MKYLILMIGLVFLTGCEGDETNISVNADDSANVQISSSGEIIAGEAEEEEGPKTGETTKEELEALLVKIDAGLI